ncbi:MAG: InlB B-repeat-containing protein [Acholeplasmataceae bacterium]|nr:InlB B-repeat-containing protein [Acholeplasmataceae bacterium]
MKKLFLLILLVIPLSSCQPKIHEVTFQTGFENSIDSVLVENGNILELPEITREGYQFLGWFVSLSSDSALYNETEPVTQSFVLYAKWRLNSYTIFYDSRGGTLIPNQTALYGESISKPIDPIKNGCEFLGWSLEEDSNEIYQFVKMPGYNLTLYAVWDEVNYTGSSPSDAIVVTLDTLYEVFLDLNQSIIFRFQPTTNGTYVLESYGEFDTYVRVFQLSLPHGDIITWDDVFQIEAEDDFGENQNFKLSMVLNQDNVYFIQVEMFFQDIDSGTIQFKIYQ